MSGAGAAHLGVRTARGDFERGLVGELLARVSRMGCSCWACQQSERARAVHPIVRLMTVEAARAVTDAGASEGARV
jgi:hypothetical protein